MSIAFLRDLREARRGRMGTLEAGRFDLTSAVEVQDDYQTRVTDKLGTPSLRSKAAMPTEDARNLHYFA